MVNLEYWNKLKDGVDYLISNHQMDDKQIFVCPADEYAVEVIEYLRDKKYDVAAIIDNRSELIGEQLSGIRIMEVQDVLYPFNKNKHIVLATSYWNISLIEKFDFIECWHNISRFLLCEDIYRKVPERVPSRFDKLVERIKTFGPVNVIRRGGLYRRAQAVIDEIMLSSAEKLYLFPHASIGDIFILGTYLSQNCSRFQPPFSLVVIGNACKKVAIESGFEDVIAISQETMDMLLFYKIFMGDELKSIEILHYDFLGRCIYNSIFDQKKFTFAQCYSCMVFNEETKYINNGIVSKKPDVKKYCKKNGIIMGKTVILAPYSKTLPDISPVFWETLARELIKSDYVVITNSGKAAERPVYGTTALSIPLEYIGAVVEYAGYFISIRSGLCDVVSGCNARKVAVLPKLKGVESTVEDFYGFKHLNLQYPFDEIECERIPNVKDTVRILLSILDKQGVNEFAFRKKQPSPAGIERSLVTCNRDLPLPTF